MRIKMGPEIYPVIVQQKKASFRGYRYLIKNEGRMGEMGGMKGKCMKILACYLVVAIFAMGVAQKVYAGFSPSEVLSESTFDRAKDLQKIQKVLELKGWGRTHKERSGSAIS